MKTTIVYILAFLMVPACTIDNYTVPEIALTGKIVDTKTGELVPSSGANDGSVVQLFEGASTQPLLFNTLPDGSFKNTRLFPASYKVVAVGPFQNATDTLIIDIRKNTAIEIKVIPNVLLQIKALNGDGDTFPMEVDYSKEKTEQNLLKIGVVWSPFPYPSVTVHPDGDVLMEDVTGQDLTDGLKTYEVEGLKSGTSYYVRAFALTDNAGGYYNYSEQVILEVK